MQRCCRGWMGKQDGSCRQSLRMPPACPADQAAARMSECCAAERAGLDSSICPRMLPPACPLRRFCLALAHVQNGEPAATQAAPIGNLSMKDRQDVLDQLVFDGWLAHTSSPPGAYSLGVSGAGGSVRRLPCQRGCCGAAAGQMHATMNPEALERMKRKRPEA